MRIPYTGGCARSIKKLVANEFQERKTAIRMKPVLPKLKEFGGEDLEEQVDRSTISSQRTKRARVK